MADKSTVQVTFKVNADGSLQQVGKAAEKTAKSMDKATSSTTNYNRAARGVANLQQNQTKAFAATARGTSGLVAAYATLMAHVFALTAAFGALQRASALVQLEQGLVAVGNAAGQNLPYVSREIQAITGHAVTLQEAMEGTALAMSAGFGINQLKELTKVARGASIALGRNMGDALTRLVKGTAKLEPEILDELGIMVRLDKASQDYAASLGKTITQLTRFEKQQAFLNATIDQGQKKFSVVIDSIDPDPYSQLSSAFQDLVKDMTTLMNKGLIPVIKFLSSSKFAMTGAIILFASSITKMLLPALGEMSTANRTAAAVASQSATNAAGKMEKKYLGAVRKVKGAFKTVPASVKAVEAQFVSGGLSVQQYKVHLNNLKKSEKLRSIALKRHSGEQAIQKKKELADIRLLIAETQKLLMVESQRGGAGVGVKSARQVGRMAKRQSIYQDKIGESSLFGGLAVAGKGSKAQFKEIGKGQKGLKKLTLGFSAATKSAGLFGSALLRFVPIIGWAFTAFSLLSPLLGGMFKQGAVAKSANEVADSFDSFYKVAAQLNTELEKTEEVLDRENKKLAVRVGLLQQVSAGVSKIFEADEAERQKAVTEALEKANAARASAAKKQRAQWIAARNVTNAELEYKKALEASTKVGSAAAGATIDQAISMIKASGNTKVFTNELEKLEVLRNKYKDKDVDKKQFFDEVEAITEPARKLKAEQESAAEATIKLEQSVKSFTEKAKGQFGELFVNTNTLYNSLLNIEKAVTAGTATDDFIPITPEQIKQVERLGKALKVAVNPTDYVGSLKKIGEQIAKNNVLASTSEKTAQRLTHQAKKLNGFAKNTSGVMALQLLIEQDILNTKIAGLNATLENMLAEEGINSASDRVLKTKAEIKKLEDQILSNKETEEKIAIAQINHTLDMLKMQQKLLSLSKERRDTERDIEMLQYRIASAKAGQEVSDFAKISVLQKRLAQAENAQSTTVGNKLSISVAGSAKRISELQKERKTALSELDKTEAPAVITTMKQQPAVDATHGAIEEVTVVADNSAQIGFYKKQKTLAERINAEYDAKEKAEKDNLAEEKIKIETDYAARVLGIKADLYEAEMRLERKMLQDKMVGMNALAQSQMTTALKQRDEQAKLVLSLDAIKNMNFESEEARTKAEDAVKGQFYRNVAANAKTAFADIGAEMSKFGGADGVYAGAVMTGIGQVTEGLTMSFQAFTDSSLSGTEKLNAGLSGLSSITSAYAAITQASTDQAIANLDKKIAAEKKSDGKSKESVSRIKALEKQKDLEARKGFEKQKKAQKAQAIIAAAQGAVSAYTSLAVIPIVGPALGAVAAAAALAMGKQQVDTINATSYQGGGSLGSGPSSISVGQRSNSVDLANSSSESGELAYMRGGRGVGNAQNFTPAFGGYKHRAAGGSTGYIVGEQGPELFVPETAGDIIPSGDTQKIAAPSNVNFSINAVDATGVEDLLVKQRGNIIKMIREAANQQGEYFLETVSESEL
ncbi:hypothetical protein N9R80_00195 [bacterium]|nr:hypothetical protein [bacterium]